MAIPTINSSSSIILLFLLQFSLLSSSHFSPIDNYLLDCGSRSAPTTLPDRRIFTSDSPLLLSSSSPKISISNPNPNPNPNPLSTTARIFTKPSSYHFQLKSKGAHLLRLHFFPFSSPPNFNISSAKFHVLAADFLLLYNHAFELHPSAPSPSESFEYLLDFNSDAASISFVPATPSSFAFVSAIELVSAPRDLIADEARLVSSDKVETFTGISKQALQTVYRLNVGGPKVTPFNDTFFRDWVPDSGFLISGSDSKVVSFSGRIMYREGGASREVAPDNVYSSARTSGKKMTWEFPAHPGCKYLIRLHFCDIASLALNELYMDVFVNGHSAYRDFDISDSTGQVLASPYYIDFVADADESGLLGVEIGPSRFSDPSKVGALLNGLEIMKISNSDRSLDGGSSSVVLAAGSARVGMIGAFGKMMMCASALMMISGIVLMLILRWRAVRRDQFAWARLPVDVLDCELVKGGAPLVSGKMVYF